MKFSVVTISYNQAQFLERTIQSVLTQDYPDIEYIVVDPGSADGSRDIIERYRNRIAKVIFEPDKGAADGLNKGFAHATGDILAFLNSDDMFLPGAVSHVAAYFRAHPSTDILMGHTLVVDSADRRLRRAYTDEFDARMFAYCGGVICQQGVFFRADLFAKTNGFNASNSIAWDAELFLELLSQAEHPLYVEEFLGAFRVHRDSITGGHEMRRERVAYERARFARIMGREWRTSDWFFWLFYRLRKHLGNPRALVERLRFGSGGI